MSMVVFLVTGGVDPPPKPLLLFLLVIVTSTDVILKVVLSVLLFVAIVDSNNGCVGPSFRNITGIKIVKCYGDTLEVCIEKKYL